MSSNPFFPYMLERIEEGIRPASAAKGAKPADPATTPGNAAAD
jgi:hypothetical protein